MATATQPENEQSSALVVRQETAIARVREALESRLDDIARILPPSMDPARFARVSLLAISKNPGLLECDRVSLVMSIIEAAEVGLEPTGGIGGAHLVPFRDKSGQKHAQLIYDYRGIQYLIREGGGGEIKTVLVYEGDFFKVYEGTENARIRHSKRFQTTEPAKIQYVYAVPLDNPTKFEVMTKGEIDGIRARSKAANAGPWVSDFGAMARKSVLKRISAWLPLKPSVRELLERDTEREIGDEPDETPARSRTAALREELLDKAPRRRRARAPAQDAPSATETNETPDVAASDASAAQQPASEPVEAADASAEGAVTEVCGAGSDPKLGEVEFCVLAPDHLNEPNAPQRHQSEAGSVWPAGKG